MLLFLINSVDDCCWLFATTKLCIIECSLKKAIKQVEPGILKNLSVKGPSDRHTQSFTR